MYYFYVFLCKVNNILFIEKRFACIVAPKLTILRSFQNAYGGASKPLPSSPEGGASRRYAPTTATT